MVRILTESEVADNPAAFSSDGSKLVFVSFFEATDTIPGSQDIFVMNTDGSNKIPLATDRFQDATPVLYR